MNNEYENLDSLLNSLYGEEEAEAVKEDIRIGDEIIASAGELVPDDAVISGIKRDISERLLARRSRRMNMISLRVVAAAMIAVVAFFGIQNMQRQTSPPTSFDDLGPDVWNFWGEDATASIMADELDEIENTILSISLGEDETESDDFFDSLEIEVMACGGSLWR